MRPTRPVVALVAAATAVVLTACGGGPAGTTTAPGTSTGAAAGTSAEVGEATLTFPAGYGVPDLALPDGAVVVPASGADDGYVSFQVDGVDAAAAVSSIGDQLREAGFELVDGSDAELGSTLQAGKEGAAVVTVVPFGDGLLLDAEPPS